MILFKCMPSAGCRSYGCISTLIYCASQGVVFRSSHLSMHILSWLLLSNACIQCIALEQPGSLMPAESSSAVTYLQNALAFTDSNNQGHVQ